ncbi:proline-rich protein 20G [Choloepus didactylus]|uniref:proline-rich protein 20G n=1 Tax=Choloepus didactylus TaxID=27675 RepID=UPI00189F2AAB|nr:proline-rich protein 20G [Choloepus didactylus]
MEEHRPPKRLRSMATNQDGHPRWSGNPGMDPKDTDRADSLVERSQPMKPFAYVKPIVREMPKLTEPAPPVERSRRRERRRRVQRDRDGEESHIWERSRHRRAGLPREASPPPELGHFMWSSFHRELDHYVEPETSQAPSYAFIEATATEEDMLHINSSYAFQLGRRSQTLPNASGYWDLMGSPTSGIYPTVGFRPLTGSTLRVVQTSFGTYVYGIPAFFTHMAHPDLDFC